MGVTFAKGEEAKRRILDAALVLFLEQGYEKTTMRQIIAKSGVLNGSVYHAFKNKDAIFEQVFNNLLDKVFEDLHPENVDVLTYAMIPLGIELKFASEGGVLGELLYHANRSWVIYNNSVNRLVEYISAYAEFKGWRVNLEKIRRYAVTVLGAVRALGDEYFHSEMDVPLKNNLIQIMDYVMSLVKVPMGDPDDIIDGVLEIIDEWGKKFDLDRFRYH